MGAPRCDTARRLDDENDPVVEALLEAQTAICDERYRQAKAGIWDYWDALKLAERIVGRLIASH